MQALSPSLPLTVVLLFGLAACDGLLPEVGPAQLERCSNSDSDPATSHSYEADLRPIIERQSAGCGEGCHHPGGGNPVGVALGGLDLSSYASLRLGGGQTGSSIIVSGQPCESLLLKKLGPTPPFGARMPLNGPPFLSAAELQDLNDWIAEGAPEQ